MKTGAVAAPLGNEFRRGAGEQSPGLGAAFGSPLLLCAVDAPAPVIVGLGPTLGHITRGKVLYKVVTQCDRGRTARPKFGER
jgi:hypothetical protein